MFLLPDITLHTPIWKLRRYSRITIAFDAGVVCITMAYLYLNLFLWSNTPDWFGRMVYLGFSGLCPKTLNFD